MRGSPAAETRPAKILNRDGERPITLSLNTIGIKARAAALARALRLPRWRLGINGLLVMVALYLALGQNAAFWHQVRSTLPAALGLREYFLLGSLFVTLSVLLVLALLVLSARAIVKPALTIFLLTASVCGYFMTAFGVVIDDQMIVNLLQTNAAEAGELVSGPLILHVLLGGILPAALVWRVQLACGSRFQELLRRLSLAAVALTVLLVCVLGNYKTLSLWFRGHHEVRMYTNPTYPINALIGQLKTAYKTADEPLQQIATDATRRPLASGKPRVVVLVVGETARAANFQLAGYGRATNPKLSAIDGLVSFSQLWSCGTATAVSVPCMFSRLGRSAFTDAKARTEENLLDVLQRTGVSVLWRDNNSNCKAVCARVPSEDFRRLKIDGLCNADGCYDEVVLHGLDELIASGTADRFIVLHLLGSHGPSYYKRYPPAFRRFVPDCAQDDVQSCSRAAIVNAYDNTILYTDHVLAQLVELLKRHQDQVDPVMLYMSDHGESLGENGLYLHGLPYAIAPDEQKHVPFLLWSPATDRGCVESRRDGAYSHDNLFHTVLGLFAVSTREYDDHADILRGCSPSADGAST